ncbi:ricin B-like lectin EULS3 [Selaginella moellendorffii]|uniref:ricin B-like lectin EULS3 n=1 Tax=Selaginella moellendorffii TaxID=88036 RepID=UPI000D1CA03B|nr:ricin B-like lectin EULS3 [Selaginella moellendorffii]|eukprot:XP_024545068.1 ricin B-like lectin EULS3 [Selaginella moellendorffii]
MGGSEEHGGYGYGGQYYPPPDPSIYPPPQGAYGSYPPIPSQDRAFDAPPYPPPSNPPNLYPAPSYEHDHHHHHHHDHHNHHHDHHRHEEHQGRPDRELGQLVKLCCQANMDFSLAVRDDGVVLVPSNHHDDSQVLLNSSDSLVPACSFFFFFFSQQWYKDMSWSTRVRDEKGFPAFALINKATRKALKHATEELQQVF